MASNYPASLDTTATLPAAAGVGANLSTFPHSAHHGNANDAIIAIETELGTAPSGTYSTVKARLDAQFGFIAPLGGAWTAWTTMTVTQGVGVTFSINQGSWMRVGRTVHARFFLSMTSAGTATTAFSMSGLPVAASMFGFLPVGQVVLNDASTGLQFQSFYVLENSTGGVFYNTVGGVANPRLGVSGFTAALASGDQLSGSITYEANAD